MSSALYPIAGSVATGSSVPVKASRPEVSGRALTALCVASVIAGMSGCRTIVEPGTLENSLGVIVSSPVSPGAAPNRASAGVPAGLQVVYVSLPPGSVPTGVLATITDQATGLSITTAVVNGGFDPVPIAASVGDTLTVEITGSGTPARRAQVVVAAARPLKVVRTSPPSGGRDVPLNAIIVIVFSEPIDSTTLTTAAVQLLRDTTTVAGTVRVSGGAATVGEFLPTNLLSSLTAYRLSVAPQIRTLAGVALASPLSVTFTTGIGPQPQVEARLVFTGQPSNATAGAAIRPPVVVTIEDALGRTVTGDTNVVVLNLKGGAAFAGLGGTVAVKPVNGVATFSDIWTGQAATGYRLLATLEPPGTLPTPTSAPFDVAPDAPASIVFTGWFTVLTAGQSFAFEVAIVDSFQNVVTSATNAVTVSLGASPSGATLSGTLTVAAVQGVAHFTNLTVDQAGPYTLVANAGTLPLAQISRRAYTKGTFVSVSAGGNHTCAFVAGSGVYCWGANEHGQLGDGTTNDRTSPVPVAGGSAFSGVVAGGSHTCGATSAGDWYCWGANGNGQLGDGTTTDRASPVLVVGGIRLAGLTLGASHTCGLGPDSLGEPFAYCWGLNDHGQLGDGTTSQRTSPTPVAAVLGRGLPPLRLDAISAGGSQTCGLNYETGSDSCWGANLNGQLDDGTMIDRTIPVLIDLVPCGSGPPGFIPVVDCPAGAVTPFNSQVTAGGAHTCAEAGGAYYLSFAWYCWGANGNGQLGDGTTTDRTTWVLVGAGRSFATVSAGGSHTCGIARTGTGEMYCWGLNTNGQLGDGTITQRTDPVLVVGGLAFLAVSAGENHTCGLTDGGVYCWGSNSSGQLGTSTTTSSSVPVKVLGQP